MTDEDVKPAEGATPERLAKAGAAVEDFITDTQRRTKRLLDGSVLDMLLSRRSINADQYNAGARFYEDWYFAGLAASGVIDPSLDVVDGGLKAQESDRKLDALTRWKDAIQAIGRVHTDALVCLLLLEEPLSVYGRRRHRRKSDKEAGLSAIISLSLALSQLDYHYYGKRDRHISTSHGANYRPGIQPIDKSSTPV